MSYTQGLSGLGAASSSLDVIGNNVANANTVGFKSSQAQFGDIFAASLSGSGSSTQIGIGAQLKQVAQQFSQGNIATSSSSLDVAINGNGFFVLNNSQGTSYSRNGQFELNKSGQIVNSSGAVLQGYAIDPNSGLPGGSPTNLTVPTAVSSAVATGQSIGTGEKGIVAGLNLDSRDLPPILPTYAFDPTNTTTFNNSTSLTTYDSKGVAQMTTMYFVKGSVTDSAVVPVSAPVVAANPSDSAGTGIYTDTTQTPPLTTVTLTNPVTNLQVGADIQGGGFPTGTTVATVLPAGAGPYTSFTTSANPVPAFNTNNVPLTIDVPNTWNVYTTVTDPTSGAYLYPSPAYNADAILNPANNPTANAKGYVSNGTLSFNTGGLSPVFIPNPSAPTPATNLTNGEVGPDNGGPIPNANMVISLAPTGANPESFPIDFSKCTQFGATFGVNTISQDGYTSGELTGFTIGTTGIIQGGYSNGQTKALGQLALATFPDNQGLQPLGSNEWAQSAASGAPVVNAPGAGNNGVLQTSATENSNVDLTTELVDMMTAQRAYQANAQTVKTADSVMQTLLNMR